jgi:hypothetical protein
MLERLRFLVRRRAARPGAGDAWDVFDPDTRQRVGLATEMPGRVATLLSRLVGRRLIPARLEVRELPDESLVFEVRRAVGGRVEVRDAQGTPVGRFTDPCHPPAGRWLFDRLDRPFAELAGDREGGEFWFALPDGQELGRVTRKGAGPDEPADGTLVTLADELAEEPIVKMLLLGAALAVGVVGRDAA